ncbi:hypothetical protein [Bradyrhizobium sp. CIR3A]|uniref:hypothetical protein n=1 Tax=Bradyrhizobium sp. CIR3A TaxID=2663838 RepID=UPI001606936D|nr:hypothetical protein [Bradyrhizobium sp. CIR3A]MBB4260156.1 hypothetical protein [Bradyrhizobium sp. CIR3A]
MFVTAWACAAFCYAQSNQKGVSRLTFQGSAEQSSSSIVRDPLGKPCLDVEAVARAHVANREIVDHVVSVKNNCSRPIKVKVCYFNTQQCNALDVQAYKRVDTILGTMNKITAFRYSIDQK